MVVVVAHVAVAGRTVVTSGRVVTLALLLIGASRLGTEFAYYCYLFASSGSFGSASISNF